MVTGGKIAVSPDTLSFSKIKVVPNQDKAFKSILISNIGNADLEISGMSIDLDPGEFGFEIVGSPTFPIRIHGGEAPLSVDVTFSPTGWGDSFPVTEHKKANLIIYSSDPSNPSLLIPLEGGQTFEEIVKNQLDPNIVIEQNGLRLVAASRLS